jgi:hypothetical protein
MTDLEAYLVPLILVMLTGTVLLYPALSTAIVEAGNVTIELLGTFNDVNKSINSSNLTWQFRPLMCHFFLVANFLSRQLR